MHLNTVLLLDRTVLVCGGALQREAKVVGRLQAEIYDPASDAWRIAASSTIPRLYHSIALLLPDGRVVAGGGNPQGRNQVLWKTRDENGNWKAADPNEELRLDVYHPPYLFRGERPVIEDTESEITYGQRFGIRSTNPNVITDREPVPSRGELGAPEVTSRVTMPKPDVRQGCRTPRGFARCHPCRVRAL